MLMPKSSPPKCNTTPTLKRWESYMQRLPWKRISPLLAALSIVLSLFGCASLPSHPVPGPQTMVAAPDPALMKDEDYRAEWDQKVQALTSARSRTNSSPKPLPK